MDGFQYRGDPTVHVVVTCANRKRQIVPEHLRVQNLNVEASDERCAAWIERLATGTPTVTAQDLYAGEHWQTAKNLPDAAAPGARLWVSSAGYGFIPATALIHPYGATFAGGQSDSVAATSAAARRWWFELTRWEGPNAGEPRSFTAIAEQNPHAVIIAVMSAPYLRACSDDLKEASARMANAESLSIFGPPGSSPKIRDLIVPVTAALRPAVGGSMQALNVRAAEHVLSKARDSGIPLRRSLLAELTAEATATAPEDSGRRPTGIKLADDDVRAFVLEQIPHGPTSATKLLRLLRDSGQSCEQTRFHAIFAEVSNRSEVLF